MDFTNYDWKRGQDKQCKKLQHVRRETFDIYGNMILRLPEKRDFFNNTETDPVKNYYRTQRDNKKFFSMSTQQKINLDEFGKPNYLTAPKNSVGVTKHKNYLIRR